MFGIWVTVTVCTAEVVRVVRSDTVKVVVSIETEPAEDCARLWVIVARASVVGTMLLGEDMAGTFAGLAPTMFGAVEDAASAGAADLDLSCVEIVSMGRGEGDSPVEICQIEV